MKHLFGIGAAVIALLSSVLLAGCGGGNSSLSDTTRGGIELRLPLPEDITRLAGQGTKPRTRQGSPIPTIQPYAGQIPFGSRSLRVTLVNPNTNTQLATRIITAPADSLGLARFITVQFTALPVGPVRADITAFNDTSAQGATLARGSVTGEIRGAVTTSLEARLTLGANSIAASVAQLSVFANQNSTFTVAVRDVDNNVIPYQLRFISSDPDLVSITQSPTTPGQFIVSTTKGQGGTSVIVYEPNSGLHVIVPVNISE